MGSFGENVKFFLDKNNMSKAALARALNTSAQNINSLLKQDRPRIDTVSNVAQALGIDPSLLTGDSPLDEAANTHATSSSQDLKKQNNPQLAISSEVKEINISETNENDLIKKIDDTEFRYIDDEHMLVICPFVDHYAYAGYMAGFSDPTYSEHLPRAVFVLDELKFGAYRAFAVKGDSMDNGLKGCYSEGDVVYAKVLQRKYFDSKLQINRHPDWIIVSKSEGVIIKEIVAHDPATGIIKYHSLNPDYEDKEIHIDDILELLYIVSPKPNRRA